MSKNSELRVDQIVSFDSTGRMSRRVQLRNSDGSILILALVFLLVTSLTVATICTWAGNSLLDAAKFNQGTSLDYAASGAVLVAAQNLRYSYQSSTNAYNCTPYSSVPSNSKAPSIEVFCTIVDNADSAATRAVTFDACSSSEPAAACEATPYLLAVISFDDYSESNQLNCSSASDQVTCGTSQSITSWDVK